MKSSIRRLLLVLVIVLSGTIGVYKLGYWCDHHIACWFSKPTDHSIDLPILYWLEGLLIVLLSSALVVPLIMLLIALYNYVIYDNFTIRP